MFNVKNVNSYYPGVTCTEIENGIAKLYASPDNEHDICAVVAEIYQILLNGGAVTLPR